DAVFFHCNLLHRSDQNKSEHPRWSMICCYNAARNDPYTESHHPRYTTLKVVPDSAIREVGIKRFADDASDVAWLENAKDRSAKLLATKPQPQARPLEIGRRARRQRCLTGSGRPTWRPRTSRPGPRSSAMRMSPSG